MSGSFNSLKHISTFHLVLLAQTTDSKYLLYDKMLNLYFPNFQNFLFESVSFILKFHFFLQNCSFAVQPQISFYNFKPIYNAFELFKFVIRKFIFLNIYFCVVFSENLSCVFVWQKYFWNICKFKKLWIKILVKLNFNTSNIIRYIDF